MDSEKIEKMCHDIVDAWDMDTLIDYARTSLIAHYIDNPEEAAEQYEEFYDYD